MAYNEELAFELLKGRMDKAGLEVPPTLANYWKTRLLASEAKLAEKGVVYDDDPKSIRDNELIADYTAYKLNNRDSAEEMPKWLSREIRERFLRRK